MYQDIIESMVTTEDKPSGGAKKFFWFNILALCVVTFLLIAGLFKGLDIYTHHGEEVIVPDVKGMMPGAADKLFLDRGLIAKVVSTSYRKDMPSGCILELTPEQGEKVKKGRIIFLTINSINAPLREVPDVTENSSAREAEAQLLTAGFHLTPNQLVKGELDWVYGVLYNGRKVMTGEKIPIGSMLTLQIGNGDVDMDDVGSDSVSLNEGEMELTEPSASSETAPADNKAPATKTKPAPQKEKNTTSKDKIVKESKPTSKEKAKPSNGKQTQKQSEHKKTNKHKGDDSWF